MSEADKNSGGPDIGRRLTKFEAVEIRRAALAGASTRELAERYGVGVHAVRAVLRYSTHVPELTGGRLDMLARAARQRGLTLDDAFDLILAEARR
jgi:hypothetical protein